MKTYMTKKQVDGLSRDKNECARKIVVETHGVKNVVK